MTEKQEQPQRQEDLHPVKITLTMNDGTEQVISPEEGGVGVAVFTATPLPDGQVDVEAFTNASPGQLAMGIATIFHRNPGLLPRVLNGMARERESAITIVQLPLGGLPPPPAGTSH